MTMSIMIQGTGSNVGKSMLVAGLARALHNRGFNVSPFKPQNMSNNAAVTSDGGEIGRAQALQALAAHKKPHTDMNPVLLKPETTTGSQVVVQGKRLASVKAKDYAALKPKLMKHVLESYSRLLGDSDFVIVEGAGSPAEINLRSGDIANIGFAQAAKVPVVLVGDIERGGVIAQLIGTQSVLPRQDCSLIKGFMVNKFRGDPSLFDDGYRIIAERTGWTGLGVVPWFDEAHLLPAEDSMEIKSSGQGEFKIVVPQLPRIANFDDLDPLKAEPNVSISMLTAGQVIPGDTDMVIIPGSKSTIDDLDFFRRQGWDIDLSAHVRRGGSVLGICGGYQMLGKTLSDPQGIEGPARTVEGLGHLDVDTVLTPHKTLTDVSGVSLTNRAPFQGYEIHIGETIGPDCEHGWLELNQEKSGARSADGRILGSYVHGIFSSDAFRRDFLANFQVDATDQSYSATIDDTLDALAEHVEKHVNVDHLIKIARKGI